MSLTKDDLEKISEIMATKVHGLATKDDLDRMESRITTTINLLERDSLQRLDEHEVRIARLEQAISK